MPDIIFKCESCRNHLVTADAGAGMRIKCPDCHAFTTIPTKVNGYQCPHCQQGLKFAADLKEETVHCPGCHKAFVLSRQASSGTPAIPAAKLVNYTCPACHAALEAPDGMSGKKTDCPNCHQQVELHRKFTMIPM